MAKKKKKKIKIFGIIYILLFFVVSALGIYLGYYFQDKAPTHFSVSYDKIDTKEEYMNRVREGFYAVLNSYGGYGVGYIDKVYSPAGKTGTSQSFLDTNNDGIIDTETITSSFIGYAPSDNPKFSILVASPDSSYPNSNNEFASYVTKRITKQVTDKFFELMG